MELWKRDTRYFFVNNLNLQNINGEFLAQCVNPFKELVKLLAGLSVKDNDLWFKTTKRFLEYLNPFFATNNLNKFI